MKLTWFQFLSLCRTYGGTTSSHICGATLIAKNLILTAAHCIYQNGQVSLPRAALIGGTSFANNGDFPESFAIVESWTSQGYSSSQWDTGIPFGDLSVLRIDGNSNFPAVQLSSSDPVYGVAVTAVGWGADHFYPFTNKYPGILQYTNLTMSTAVPPCSFSSAGVICSAGQATSSGQYPSVCQGDSGGPQFLQGTNIQVGINSFVKNTVTGCGSNTYTGMTSVGYFRSGILNVITNYGVSDGQTPTPTPSPNPSEVNTTPTPPVPESPSPEPESPPLPSPSPPVGEPTPVCIAQAVKTVANRRYLNTRLMKPAYTVAAFFTCSKACQDSKQCNSFQYMKKTRACSLFSTKGTSSVSDLRYSSGFKYCTKYSSDGLGNSQTTA